MNYNEFAEKVKTKYPEYKDIDNMELAKKVVAKYPQYQVDFGEVKSQPITKEKAQLIEQQPTPMLTGGVQTFGTGEYDDILSNPNLTKEQKAAEIQKRGEAQRKQYDKDLNKWKAKAYTGLALELGSALIPVGAGARLGASAIKALAPKVGKLVARDIGTGLASGAVSGTIGGIGQGMIDDKDIKGIAQSGLIGAGVGALAGGAIGGATGKISQNAKKAEIVKRKSTPLAERMTTEQLENASIKPSQYGVYEIDTNKNKQLVENLEKRLNQEDLERQAEQELLNEYKTLRQQMSNKYGGLNKLREQAIQANNKKAQTGEISEALNDYQNLISYEQELGNAKYIKSDLAPLATGKFRAKQAKPKIKEEVTENIIKPTVQEEKIIMPHGINKIAPKQVVEATGNTKERGFVDTVRQKYGDNVAKQITDKEYDVYSHEMQKANWENRTPEQKIQALNEVDNINPDVLYGKAQALNQAIQNGEPLNVAMLDGVAKNLTKAGQEIEAAKHFIPTSPEGIVLETIKQTRKNTPKQVLKLKDETSQIVDEVAKTLPKQKTREQQLKAIERILSKRTAKPREQKSLATQLLALNDNNGLTPENFARLVDKHYGIQTIDVSDYAKIQELSNRFINATTDRERDVANGLIKKFIWNKQPKKWADKDRTFRNMNMLLSIPSRLLDVTSTTAFQGINALDELVAKGIDKISRTGVRGSIKNMSPKAWAKSVARGAKEGAEDVGLGINTARSGEVDRYELGFHPQFEGVPILGGAEKTLNATIRIPDRMFYESRFDSALKDLMSTGKFTAKEAEEIARNEALQAVFQGQGLLSKGSKFVRDLLNARIDNKPMFDNETVQRIADNIQLGNRVAPFVQTPANLIAEGLERTPLGLVKGGFEMATATTPQQLRQAQQTLAKGITGTGATLGGGYLLNQAPNTIGGFTNEDLYGDDVRNLPPQSVVIGDKAVSLASMPYLTIPAGLGKALLEPDKTTPERLLNAYTYTGNILSDLPMLKGLGDLYKGGADVAKVGADYALGRTDLADVGQSVGRVAGQQGANILSQYLPFSGTLGTIRNAVDPFNREMMTYNENPLLGTAEYIGNRLQNRIPFASSLLPMKYNVLGEPSMRTNIENPVARIAEATLSPVRIRNYTERPAEIEEMQRIQDYAMENDITGKTTLKFAKPKRYIGRGKDKTRLTNEQYSELTRLYNGKLYDELQFLMNTPEYQSQDEEVRIKWVREVMKEVKEEAENELLNSLPDLQ